jgi:hypothetical protein
MLFIRERTLMVELARLIMVRRAGTPKHSRPTNFNYREIGVARGNKTLPKPLLCVMSK